MKRRDFVSGLGVGALASVGLGACARDDAAPAAPAARGKTYKWKMVTTWPPNFPGLGTAAAFLARAITEMSGRRLEVKLYSAGELVPAFEVFNAVSRGTAELGHGVAYYWKGKVPAAQFFGAVPFGMNAQEINGWLYHGGGHDLWQEIYAPFGVIPFPAGNTGVQMGGWFNREINSLDDLKGLDMRIPGLGGEVLLRAGGNPVSLPGSEIFTALQTGSIDATEWVGPYNDLAFGLYKAAKYYYYPGWHEPGPTLELTVNKKAFESLPGDLQAIIRYAARAANDEMLAEYTARNHEALATLVNDHGVDLRPFPSDVLTRLEAISHDVLTELAAKVPGAGAVYESYRRFAGQAAAWHEISERAYYEARGRRTAR